MICLDVETRLDDYLDGELPEEDRRLVKSHLETCLSCNRALRELRSLVESARQLPTEREPEESLWPGIESRIAARPAISPAARVRRIASSLRPFGWAPLAAAALLLLAIAVPFLLEQSGPDPDPTSPVEQTANPVSQMDSAATAMLARSEDGVLLPRSDLLTTLEMKRDILPTEVLAALEENARLVDQAIAEVRTALSESPDNRQLELLLAARYQQEVALLKQVNRV